jgi:hypothetical protein
MNIYLVLIVLLFASVFAKHPAPTIFPVRYHAISITSYYNTDTEFFYNEASTVAFDPTVYYFPSWTDCSAKRNVGNQPEAVRRGLFH